MNPSIEALEKRNLLTFAIDLVQDINATGVGSNIGESVVLGSELVFVADDGVSGRELWKSDGTTGGTSPLKDISPGPHSSDPQSLAVVGDEIFFIAIDASNETDLWKTDGTESGTIRVFDANQSGVYQLANLTESGGKLFFTAYENSTSRELWIHDQEGTRLVKDINPQPNAEGPTALTDVDGTLFFASYSEGYHNKELWKSDGTASGTMMVADIGIDPGLDSTSAEDDDPSISSHPSSLTDVNGVLYFVAEHFEDGIELFRSDGTEGGTVIVTDVTPGFSSYPSELTAFGDSLLFSAVSNAQGDRHVYIALDNSVSLLKDTTAGLGSSDPREFTVVGDEAFFTANGAKRLASITVPRPTLTAQNALSEGGFAGVFTSVESPSRGILDTFSSTTSIHVIPQGGIDDGSGWVGANALPGDDGVGLQSIGINDLYLHDLDDGSPGDLDDFQWEWNIQDLGGISNISFAGFASGNQMASHPDNGLTFELFLNGQLNDTLEIGEDTQSGPDLDNWAIDRDAHNVLLTAAGGSGVTSVTVRLSLGVNGTERLPQGSDQAFLINAALTADLGPESTLFESTSTELHKTDGTSIGTSLVKDIVPVGGSNPSDLIEVDGRLFFSADDVTEKGRELWTSDGSAGGTVAVLDSSPGFHVNGTPRDGRPKMLGSLGSQLLLTTSDLGGDRELWASDGTTTGTSQVANINQGTGDAGVRDFVVIDDSAFFVANDGIHGDAIWRLNSTSKQVEMLVDATPSSVDRIEGLVEFNGQLLFYNNISGLNGGIYLADLSGSSTLVAAKRPESLDPDGTLFVPAVTEFYFVASDQTSGSELWSSGGTLESTEIVEDYASGPTGSSPRDLVFFDGQLYFAADSPDQGRELHTLIPESGITLAHDIWSGPMSGRPQQLTVSGGRLYYTANDGASGTELYLLDANGPMIQDIRPGSEGSSPSNLTDVEGTLYFAADDGVNGVEPFRIDENLLTLVALGDINPNGDSLPEAFFAALGKVFFSAEFPDGFHANSQLRELFNTDGSEGGIQLSSYFSAVGNAPDVVTPLFDKGDRLITSVGDDTGELWVAKTIFGESFPVDPSSSIRFVGENSTDMFQLGETIYFPGNDGSSGRELFQMNTTPVEVFDAVIGGQPGELTGSPQRSIVDLIQVVFDDQVELSPSAITLENLNTETVLTSLDVNTSFVDGRTFAEITFGDGPSVVSRDANGTTGQRNALADGNYLLTLKGDQVTSSASGRTMASDYQFGNRAEDHFYALFGDVDADRDVDGINHAQFAATGHRTLDDPGYEPTLDSNGDGVVDSYDFVSFLSRLLTQLPPFPSDLPPADDAAPTTESVTIESNSVIRTIQLNFSEQVTVTDDAVRLLNLDSGNHVGVTIQSASPTDTVTVTFNGSHVDPSGSLEDGHYLLTIIGSQVSDLAGNQLEGNVTDEFFRYFGDTDGDGDVDGQDYRRFGKTFLKLSDDPEFNTRLDFDGDGDVDGRDYNQFGLRFLTTRADLPPSGEFFITGPRGTSIGNQPIVTWQTTDEAISYHLVIATTSDCSNVVEQRLGLTTNTAVVGPLENGTYFACVTAVSGSGETTEANNNGFVFDVDFTSEIAFGYSFTLNPNELIPFRNPTVPLESGDASIEVAVGDVVAVNVFLMQTEGGSNISDFGVAFADILAEFDATAANGNVVRSFAGFPVSNARFDNDLGRIFLQGLMNPLPVDSNRDAPGVGQNHVFVGYFDFEVTEIGSTAFSFLDPDGDETISNHTLNSIPDFIDIDPIIFGTAIPSTVTITAAS